MDLTPKQRFLRACRRESVDRPPAWLMRQAGRYMAEYRAVKERVSFLELCKSPELCRDVTLQPIEAFGLEVGIIFSDILLPCEAMGQGLTYEGGPQLTPVVRTRRDVEALQDFDARVTTPWPADALRLTTEALGDEFPILGFCGAPFTLASYMVEGAGSRNYENLKRMLFGEPDTLRLLLDRITEQLIPYLRMQIEAGAAAVQIFDSWGGCLGADDYRAFSDPWTRRLIDAVADLGAPVVSYVNGGGHLLEILADSGAEVVSLDWRVDPADARRRIGDRVALQGNLDPCALLATPDVAARETARNLAAFGDAPGHIFNLGSGVLKWTPVECVRAVVDTVCRRRS
ncbi:MAG: uroporphyrinogen decarboxylase [Planctomycetes bacterium]|nr:uroporphyrinogen decarboxylase [Planctomycetota bacterium]